MDEPLTRAELLIVKAADGLLDPPELAELNRLASDDPVLQAMLTDQMFTARELDGLGARLRLDAELEPLRPPGRDRALKWTGGALVALGGLLVGSVVLRELLEAATRSVVGLGALMILTGFAVLLSQMVRRRLRAEDPYEEIDR